MSDLRYLRRKQAKGKTYWYFDTGQRDVKGKPILTRLPDKRDLAFGGAYARALAARTARGNVIAKGAVDLDELIRRYERSPQFRKKAENTKRSYSRYLQVANRMIRSKSGGSPVAASLQAPHVAELRDKLADTPGAANQTIRALSAMFVWAVKPEQGYAKSNPCANITLFEGGEHEPWADELVEAALLDPDVQREVGVLYFTGQRIGDAVRMKPTDIERGQVKVYAQKTKSWLWIDLAADLKVILGTVRKDTLALLTNARGQPYTASGLRQKLQKWAADRGHKIVPHGLRKNAVNTLLVAGCTVAEVSAITDHSLAMVEHYAKGRNKARIGRGAIIKLDDHRSRTKREEENDVKTATETGGNV